MKPLLTEERERSTRLKATEEGAAALCLQEELVAAIYAAFELAVQVAVRDVKKLVARTRGDGYGEIRRENESLRQRLKRAEAQLSEPELPKEAGGSPPPPPFVPSPPPLERPPEVRTAGSHSHALLSQDHQHHHESRDEEQTSDDDDDPPEQHLHAASDTEDTRAISPGYVMKTENMKQPCQDLTAQPSPEPPGNDANSTLEQVKVKQEQPEEDDEDDLSCCLDSVKMEDFSLESVSDAPLKEWEPGVTSELHVQLSCSRQAQAHSLDVSKGLPQPADLPSLSSEFPIFQLPEPAPQSEAPSQMYGVPMRTSHDHGHSVANLYTCKFCGQTFHLPSLLRRHHGQCRQKLMQGGQPPAGGGNRNRLQLYPPGCSPFRCTVCSREFNRMENLKTHLRIHTGEKPYTCSVCAMCFRHSGALTRHFRIHTGEKPYICGQCGKTFRNCGGLKFHQRSHNKQLQ